jgi:NADH-quinone oxidoreductase subunit K
MGKLVNEGKNPASFTHLPIHNLPIATLMITPTHYMLLSAALFIIGVVGVMVRRNIIIIFMSIELILNAVNINLIAYSAQLQNLVGQVFAIFVIAVAAAEAAVGLGIILAFYRNKETVNIDEMNLMKF